MEDDSKEIQSTTALSFKVASKTKKVLPSGLCNRFDNHEKDEEVHYVAEVNLSEENLTAAKKKSHLVIPMIEKNQWQNDESADKVSDLEKVAIQEIMTDLEKSKNLEETEVAQIPLMMRNRVPAPKDGRLVDEKYDISLRPEESTLNDYSDIPVSSFGSALLRGMGWSEGEAIGKTNKTACQPIEYIPRHKGLGLGADKVVEKSKRKRKLGEDPCGTKNSPIIDDDGRVRHIRNVGEVGGKSKSFIPGGYIQILKHPHDGLKGKIISVDEDTARISVKVLMNDQIIHISQHNAKLIDKEDVNKCREESDQTSNLNKRKEEQNFKHSSKNGKTNSGKKIEKYCEETMPNNTPPWLQQDIRVRIISRSYKGGRYYNKKVTVVDVVSVDRCMCKTDDNEILNNVRESYLETVVPKTKGTYVKVLRGRYKGHHGKLAERNKRESVAILELLSNKEIKKFSFDDIAEFTGSLYEDDLV